MLAIRKQFNVSGEEKGSLLVIPKVISVALSVGVDGGGAILQRYFLLVLFCIIAFATSCKKSMLTLAVGNDHRAGRR